MKDTFKLCLSWSCVEKKKKKTSDMKFKKIQMYRNVVLVYWIIHNESIKLKIKK